MSKVRNPCASYESYRPKPNVLVSIIHCSIYPLITLNQICQILSLYHKNRHRTTRKHLNDWIYYFTMTTKRRDHGFIDQQVWLFEGWNERRVSVLPSHLSCIFLLHLMHIRACLCCSFGHYSSDPVEIDAWGRGWRLRTIWPERWTSTFDRTGLKWQRRQLAELFRVLLLRQICANIIFFPCLLEARISVVRS